MFAPHGRKHPAAALETGVVRIALAQIDLVVGDLEANGDRVAASIAEAKAAGADLVLLPELAITGYPPEDLLLRPAFVQAARATLERVAAGVDGITALVGCPLFGRDLANACAVLRDGAIVATYGKHYLPNYGVFDEHRYFAEGRELVLLRAGETLVGPTICEDIWQPGAVTTELSLAGAHVIANISASPFHLGKAEEREEMLVTRARDNACYLAFCNLVGGQDELVFDGHSVVLDDEGNVIARAPGFEEALLVVDIDPGETLGRRLRDVRRRELERVREHRRPAGIVAVGPLREQDAVAVGGVTPFEPELEQMRLALGLGLRDYVEKNGFGDVVVGISGGIDSALTAALCVEALGADRVHAVSMPSRYSSGETQDDARLVSERLGIDFREIAIEPVVGAFDAALAPSFAGRAADLAEENLQARIRGTLLMALSNKLGWLVISTGNKSEMAVGYATLYGDMAGGFALLKDVFKTDVFRLARHLNERAGKELIPVSTIERPPTAELRAEQRDDQSLPPYELLDPVLEAYVELDRSREELVAAFDPAVVERALGLVDRAEYKRRQAAPGVKLRPRAFGRDWRPPITNRWRG
jgi:NAD+ synthase (glutamine-hydrolysing)